MTKAPNAGEAIQKLIDKDAEPNNASARTNELLAARDGGDDADPVKAALRANDPSLSNVAYTSAKSGFNEDLDRETDDVPKGKPAKGQTKSVNR